MTDTPAAPALWIRWSMTPDQATAALAAMDAAIHPPPSVVPVGCSGRQRHAWTCCRAIRAGQRVCSGEIGNTKTV